MPTRWALERSLWPARRAAVLAVGVAVLALLLSSLVAPRSQAVPGEDTRTTVNPDLVASCGIDIHVILDESGSIGTAGATQTVRQAFSAFTQAIRNTGSRLAVSEFSTVARLPLGGAAQQAYTAVTDDTIATIFDPYISGFNPSGSTNWEDAFRMGRYFLPRPSADIPHLTVFITDGDPNRVINANIGTTAYQTQVPLTDGQTSSATASASTTRAVNNVNAIRAQGSHVLAVAVGNGLTSQASLDRLIQVSGPDVYDGTGDFDIATTDVYRVAQFDQLEEALRLAAFDLCSPSVTVRKLVDQDADPGVDPGALIPGEGWEMNAEVSPEPEDWILPPTADGPTATTVTDGSGFASFQWEPTQAGDADITITESDPGAGLAFLPEASECTYRTQDQPDDVTLPIDDVVNGFATTVPDGSIVTCTIINEVVPVAGVTITKYTNGADANDEASAPHIPVGQEVRWTYVVTNTGNTTLTELEVTDDRGVEVTCPEGPLPAAESVTCTATGTSVVGPYTNLGTVTATDSRGTVVNDSDPSSYIGSAPGIAVVKTTNGEDANEVPGPYIPVGDPVAWTYAVSNTGTAALADVSLTDDQIGAPIFLDGDANGNDLLDVDEVWTYTATGTAVAGQYGNLATVTATDSGTDEPVSASDPSHYFGEELGVTIVKTTNGEDANEAPGPILGVGEPVTWRYTITNTGNVPLTWSVTDDQVDALRCPRIGLLVPGNSLICVGAGTAEAGQYDNTGTVLGTAPSGRTRQATDPSHYFGVVGGIEVEKLTNGEDADLPPGPVIPVGGDVTWDYVVTNTGNDTLTDIEVTDDREVSVSCPSTTLGAGAEMTCTATGTAAAGQYTNFGMATGVTSLGVTVSDSDPSNHFGDDPGLSLVKLTNGVDSAEMPGVLIPVGDEVVWTYVVTNTGNSALADIDVTDDQGVDVSCPQTELAAGESMTCEASGTAVEGQYTNTATATATGEQGTLTDTDVDHYFGTISALQVLKRTNGEDASSAPGVEIPVGDAVTWTYEVSNTGNVAVLDPQLSDDQGVEMTFDDGDVNGDGVLDPGETWLYSATGTAVAGQYTNLATVEALDVLENPLTASDSSNYLGVEPTPPPETTPAPTPAPSTSPPAAALPGTGSDPVGFVLAAVALVLAGAALVLIRRRHGWSERT